MSKATEIANNVWLGPTPDSALILAPEDDDQPTFDIFIDANDLASPPDAHALKRIAEGSHSTVQHMEFPSSGSIASHTYTKSQKDPATMMCQWMNRLANPKTTPETSEDEVTDGEGDIPMKVLFPTARKILIHCTDGYTESTLLALAYFMHAEQIPLHEAWLRLHCEKRRNFFAYPSDVALLISLQSRLVPSLSPRRGRVGPPREEPAWLARMDGSLPSRILPYMYLGNLCHANNPDLLKAMGIKQLLSVGEPVNWSKTQLDTFGEENILFIDRVQDNGVDPLMKDFERCLSFLGKPLLSPNETLLMYPSQRQSRLHRDPSPLSRGRFPLRYHLHRRSNGLPPPLLPTRILFRARSPPECDYPTASALRVRVAEVG